MNKKNFVIIVVGAGGTGTYFLKEFARFIAGAGKMNRINQMYIFDGDSVEKKNLSRQCFLEEDIGRNKSSVMAEILNDAFDTNFTAKATYLNELSQLKKLAGCFGSDYGDIPVIVSCVDNHGCRLLLESYFNDVVNCVYFDSANEFDTGEVVYSYKFKGNVVGPLRSTYFPDIKKGDVRNREEISCEELNTVAPQHIFTNMLAGNLLCSGIANLLSDRITPGFAYFNSLKYESAFVPWKGGETHAKS